MNFRSPAAVAGTLSAAFLGVFLMWPLGVILVRSFSGTAGISGVLGDPWYWRVAGFTFGQALLSTVLTLLFGLPAALAFARWSFPGRKLLRSAFTIPFVMPTVVAGMGFLALAGPNGLLGVNLSDSFALILLAHVFYNVALVVRIVGSYLETAARLPEQAAATLGAGSLRTLFRVTLPLARPAIIAAAALVFVLTFTSFGVLMILAPSWSTLEVEIYRLTARLLQLDAAALLVMVQLLVVGLSTVLYTRWQARLAVPVTGAAGVLPPARGLRLAGIFLLLLPAALLTVTPLLALTVQTFFRPGPLPGLGAFRQLLQVQPSAMFPGVGRALLNSLTFAAGSTAVALTVGSCFAFAVVRAGWRWLDSVSLLPLAASAVTLGFGYLLAFPQLTLSPWGIILAHSLIAFPFVTRSLLPALRGIPGNLLSAGQTLGAGPLSLLQRVELPLLVPALLTAAAFAFAISLGEFGASLVITRPEFATVPVAIFDRLSRPGAANYSAALALSFLLMVQTAVIMLLLERPGRTEL